MNGGSFQRKRVEVKSALRFGRPTRDKTVGGGKVQGFKCASNRPGQAAGGNQAKATGSKMVRVDGTGRWYRHSGRHGTDMAQGRRRQPRLPRKTWCIRQDMQLGMSAMQGRIRWPYLRIKRLRDAGTWGPAARSSLAISVGATQILKAGVQVGAEGRTQAAGAHRKQESMEPATAGAMADGSERSETVRRGRKVRAPSLR